MKLAGGIRPHASEQTLGRRSTAKIRWPVGKQQPHAVTLFGSVQKVVMKACSSMQPVVEAGAWTGESDSTTC